MVSVTLYRVHVMMPVNIFFLSFQSTPTPAVSADRTAVPQFQLQAVDYCLRLPKGWMMTLDPCDKPWVGRSLGYHGRCGAWLSSGTLTLVIVVIVFIVSRASDLVRLVKKLLGVGGWCSGGYSTLGV